VKTKEDFVQTDDSVVGVNVRFLCLKGHSSFFKHAATAFAFSPLSVFFLPHSQTANPHLPSSRASTHSTRWGTPAVFPSLVTARVGTGLSFPILREAAAGTGRPFPTF
jgi:hypothetical protein